MLYDHILIISHENAAHAEVIIISYINKKKNILERFKCLELARILSSLFRAVTNKLSMNFNVKSQDDCRSS